MIKSKKNDSLFSYIKDSFLYIVAEGTSKFLWILAIPILTRLISPEDFGLISLFDSITVVLTVLFSLSFEESVKRYFYEEKENFDEFIGTVIILISIWSIFFLLIITYLNSWLAEILSVPKMLLYFSSIVALISIPKLFIYKIWNAERKSTKFSFFQITGNILILTITLTSAYYLLDDRYMSRVYASFSVSLILLFICSYFLIKKASFKFNKQHLIYALNFSIPLIPYKLSGIIITFFDTIIIATLINLESVGIYSIGYKIGMSILIIHVALSIAFDPILMRLLKLNNILTSNEIMNFCFLLVSSFGLLISLFSNEIVILISTPDYYEASKIVPIICLSYVILFCYEQFTRVNRFEKKTILNTISMIISSIVNVLLNFIFIPKFGLVAAAFTTLFSMIFLVFLNWFFVRKILNIKLVVDVLYFLKSILLLIFLYILSLNFYPNTYILNLIFRILISIILIYYCYTSFKKIKNNVKEFQ